MKAAKERPTTIDAYIAGFPPEVQALLEQVRQAIRAEAPEAVEAIKYQIPTFVLQGNLVHFAAFTRHIGLYPGPSGIAAFQAKLSRYHSAKGSVQFPIDEPMPLALIREIVRFRVRETLEAAAAKKRR